MGFKHNIRVALDVSCFLQGLGSPCSCKSCCFFIKPEPTQTPQLCESSVSLGKGENLEHWVRTIICWLSGGSHPLSKVSCSKSVILSYHAMQLQLSGFSWYMGISSFLDLLGCCFFFFPKYLISPLNIYHFVLHLQRTLTAVSKAFTKPL